MVTIPTAISLMSHSTLLLYLLSFSCSYILHSITISDAVVMKKISPKLGTKVYDAYFAPLKDKHQATTGLECCWWFEGPCLSSLHQHTQSIQPSTLFWYWWLLLYFSAMPTTIGSIRIKQCNSLRILYILVLVGESEKYIVYTSIVLGFFLRFVGWVSGMWLSKSPAD